MMAHGLLFSKAPWHPQGPWSGVGSLLVIILPGTTQSFGRDAYVTRIHLRWCLSRLWIWSQPQDQTNSP